MLCPESMVGYICLHYYCEGPKSLKDERLAVTTNNIVEIVIYIHGVSQGTHERAHDTEYMQLHQGIEKWATNWPKTYCGVEWGGNPFPQNPNPTSHKLLAKAQRHLGSRVMPVIDRASDWTLNPARLAAGTIRKMAFYGFSDMFYYVSRDGKKAVRTAVAEEITKFIDPKVNDDDLLSISILGHSAGSVVAFDFLFYLFSNKKSAAKFCTGSRSASEAMQKLEGLVASGTLRLRRLVTFGSPLSFTIFRNDAILKILASDKQLNPSDYGLTSNFSDGYSQLSNPRWINFWDKDDPISFPIEPLVDQSNSALALDVYSDVSDRLTQAHNAYWGNEGVHREIGTRW